MSTADESQNTTEQPTPEAADVMTPEESPVVAVMPGAQLRAARESKGLSIEQVAKETMLTARYLTALENDDYEVLPGNTFVRGYLRRYGPVVGLAADPLIADYDAIWKARNLEATPLIDAQVHALQQERVVSRRGNRRSKMFARSAFSFTLTKLLSWGSVILLIGLLVATFFWNSSDEPEPVTLTTEQAELDMSATTPANDVAEVPVAAMPEEPSTDAASAAQAAATPDSSAGDAPVAAAVTAEQAVAAVVEQASSETAPAVPPVVTSVPDASAEIDGAAPRDTLSFVFTGKSWISVRDATGQELVYGLKNAGQSVTVTGRPPFAINIGSVKDTQMSRNGTPVNLKPYTRGEIASFRLGR